MYVNPRTQAHMYERAIDARDRIPSDYDAPESYGEIALLMKPDEEQAYYAGLAELEAAGIELVW